MSLRYAGTRAHHTHLQQLDGLDQATVTNVHGWLDLFLKVGTQICDELDDGGRHSHPC
jgi:hypothetical protein